MSTDEPSGGRREPRDAFSWALGRTIKVLRTERGMDRRELAERAGVSYSYVAEMENGHKPPSPSVLSRIAAGLDVPIHELYRAAEDRAQREGRRSTSPQNEPVRFLREQPSLFQALSAPSFEAQSAGEPEQARAADAAMAALVLRELEVLVPMMSATDLARVLDLARRLSR